MAKFIVRKPSNSVVGSENGTGESESTDSVVEYTVARKLNGTGRESTTDDNEPSEGESRDFKKFVNPADASSGSDSGGDTTRRRRKRSDAGTSRGTRQKRSSETAQDLKSLLLMIHFSLAGVLHAPKLKLTEEEAGLLADASKRVMDLYEVEILSPEKRAWLNLVCVAGCIYLPRFKKDKEGAKEPEKQRVVNADMGRVVTIPVQPVGNASGVN